ncbi:MAG: endonuclease III [Legionella sp. 21-45-4]|nr:MAG: endonuclease III [Legionella sp. 21-45-4]
MNKQQINTLFNRLAKENPNPTTELNYSSAFELLIAVILSEQSTDIRVNLVTQHLFKLANTPEAMLALGEPRLKHVIQSIGLFNTKARNIILTCAQLVEEHQSHVPETRVALERLPGVGRKTANVVLNTAFNQPTMAVDTHIFRVANRTGLAPARTPFAVEQGLLAVIPNEFIQNAHHWLILHGRYVCTAKRPHCSTCIIRDLCEYSNKTKVTPQLEP